MLSGSALLTAGAALLFLGLSGLWADRRFADYAKMPLHYGFGLKPTRMGSRAVAIWLPTATMALVLVLNVALVSLLGDGRITGDSDTALTIGSVVIVAAQIFILWLHTRWANQRG